RTSACLWFGCLGPIVAYRRDRAAPAFGLARLADVTPEQDQPVMRLEQVIARDPPEQDPLHRRRRFPGRHAAAVRNAENVGIDRDGRLAECDVEDHVGGLAADTRQGFERLAVTGYFAAMALDQE